MIGTVYSFSNLISVESETDSIDKFSSLKLSIGPEFFHSERRNRFTIKHDIYLLNRRLIQSLFIDFNLKLDESFTKIFIKNLSQNKFKESDKRIINKGEFLSSINNTFKRSLKDYQLSNALKLLEYNSGATFSVPGAGKTTEILSVYNYFRNNDSSLKILVICPKNAVSTWSEEFKDCFNDHDDFNKKIRNKKGEIFKGRFALLSNGIDNVEYILKQNPDLMIVTFQSNVNYELLISEFISKNNVFCVIDESHKIKLLPGKYTKSVLSYSVICKHKYIMSGTPMPQSEEDLKSQYGFIFPESLCKDDYYHKIKSIYVRTTKKDIGLEPPIINSIEVEMSNEHRELYDKIKDWYRNKFLDLSDKIALRNLKGCVMHLLQLTSNPMIVKSEEFQDTVKNLGLENIFSQYSIKFNKVLAKTRELVKSDEKVLIWTSFTDNIDILKTELIDLNPVIIDGRVPVEGENEYNEIGSRKKNIERFKNDPNCKVFIANPAAASEGMSLHIDDNKNKVCSKAIYLDRNFNCSQFLQSIDRIHRIGSTETPEIFIYKTKNSIDARVQSRLDEKVDAMRILLDDKSLLPYISNESFYPNEDVDIVSEEEKMFYIDCLNK